MKYSLLVIPTQNAKSCVELIGKQTSIQFTDMNKSIGKRPFRKQIQRIEEMERMIRFITDEIVRLNVTGAKIIRKGAIDGFLEFDDAYNLDDIEAEITSSYYDHLKFKDNDGILKFSRDRIVSEIKVVMEAGRLLQMDAEAADEAELEEFGMDEQPRHSAHHESLVVDKYTNLLTVAGVMLMSDEARFQRAIFRTSRGKTLVHFRHLEEKMLDFKTMTKTERVLFVIYFQGGHDHESSAMRDRIINVCSLFGVSLYKWPHTQEEAMHRMSELTLQLGETEAALVAFENFLEEQLQGLVSKAHARSNSKVEEWRLICLKEKSLFATLNMMEGETHFRAHVWYPERCENQIQSVLMSMSTDMADVAYLIPADPGNVMPPTCIRTNDLTAGWQEVVNTYGIPRYQEANPALLAVVSFPFIFGMMYGDVGHGLMLTAAGIVLIAYGEKLRNTQPSIFMMRYCVLQLGLFAIFSGLLYNDFFSLGLQLFSSRWEVVDSDHGTVKPKHGVDIYNSGNAELFGPYPFGIDWMWHGATNELIFVNSLKMKLSVLFGVLQMLVGILLRWSNAFYEKNWTNLFCECIPMMIFLLCFFGWMNFMILYKWVTPMDNPPGLINSMIVMAMRQEDKAPLWNGSVETASVMMFLTILSVPILLIPKPLILYLQHRKKTKVCPVTNMHPLTPANSTDYLVPLLEYEEAVKHAEEEHEFELTEVIIHQVIETIEFVLGTVSHTASYLRIWALSLAHQQLSLVFYEKTLANGLRVEFPMNIFVLYFLYAMWFAITVGVLLFMDVLECFLHTLRLHWVEFQTKFFMADGNLFEPYNIRTVLLPAKGV